MTRKRIDRVRAQIAAEVMQEMRDMQIAQAIGRAYGKWRRAMDETGFEREVLLIVAMESLLSALTRDRSANYTRAETLHRRLGTDPESANDRWSDDPFIHPKPSGV